MDSLKMKIYFSFLFLMTLEATMFRLKRISSPVIDLSLIQAPFAPVYTTRVKFGYPPQNFTVLIDTGSDIMGVPCKFGNNTYPEASFHQYDNNFSTSARLVSCPHNGANVLRITCVSLALTTRIIVPLQVILLMTCSGWMPMYQGLVLYLGVALIKLETYLGKVKGLMEF